MIILYLIFEEVCVKVKVSLLVSIHDDTRGKKKMLNYNELVQNSCVSFGITVSWSDGK